MEWRERIVSDPEILMGKAIIKGTRIAVGQLLELFANNWSEKQVLENYPQLTNEDLRAVFAYSAARIKDEETSPLKTGTRG